MCLSCAQSSCIASHATYKYKRVTVAAVGNKISIANTKRRMEFGDGGGCGYHAFMMTSYCQATLTSVFVPRDGFVSESLPRDGVTHRCVNNVFQADDVYVLLVPSTYIHSKAPGHAQDPKYDLGKVVDQPSPAFAFPPGVGGAQMMAAAPVPVEVPAEEVIHLDDD